MLKSVFKSPDAKAVALGIYAAKETTHAPPPFVTDAYRYTVHFF